MTDTPKDGDLGAAEFGDAVQYNGTDWLDWYGSRNNRNITPTGERAIPIDVCRDAAAGLRDYANEFTDPVGLRELADILDPPTPEPEPRWPKGTELEYGDGTGRYRVNAQGVPVFINGDPTSHPVDSDKWRVVGTFTPKGDG